MITPLQPTALPAELSSDVEIKLKSTLKDVFLLMNYNKILTFLFYFQY